MIGLSAGGLVCVFYVSMMVLDLAGSRIMRFCIEMQNTCDLIKHKKGSV